MRVRFECHRGFSSKCCLLSFIIFYFTLPLIGPQKPLYHLNQSDTKQSYIVSFFSSSFFVRWEGRKQTSSHQQIHACCHCFRASARYGRAIVIVYIWKRKSFLLIQCFICHSDTRSTTSPTWIQRCTSVVSKFFDMYYLLDPIMASFSWL